MVQKQPTMFVFTPFGLSADRAAETSIAMLTDIIFDSLSPDGRKWDRDTIFYVRKNMNIWANTHAEANYLYFTFGRYQSNFILQLAIIKIKEDNNTREKFKAKLKEVFHSYVENKTSPLN